jgi:hypothetical protein
LRRFDDRARGVIKLGAVDRADAARFLLRDKFVKTPKALRVG